MSKVLLFIILGAGLVACAPNHEGSNGSSVSASSFASTPQTLQAFASTLHSFGQSAGCIKCHGASVNPQWMNPDINIAYSFARPILNVNDPANSLFAAYAGNNHCNDPVCNVPSNVPIVQDLLAQWAAVELSQATNGLPPSGGTTLANPPYYTATLPIPANLPVITSSTPAVIRFNLSQLTPSNPALNGVILEVSIALFNSAGTNYKVFNPRIAGNSAPVSVSSLHVYVRAATGSGIGTEDPNQGDIWASLSAIAAPVALPGTLPSGPLTVAAPLINTSLSIGVRSASDVMTLGFQSIQ
jgi:hypothetical protein